MWRPAVVGQIREMQAIALSIEPPVPCCLRNPDLGYRPGHSSATGLAGTEDSSKTALEAWMLRGAVRYGLLETPARLTRNGEDRLGRLGARGVWFPSTSSGQALRRAQDGLITNGGWAGACFGEAWVLSALWFDTGRRGRRPGSPRTGGGLGLFGEGWVVGALWFDTAFRGLQAGSPGTGVAAGDGDWIPGEDPGMTGAMQRSP